MSSVSSIIRARSFGIGPSSCPKSHKTWLTLSMRKVVLPCSRSRMNRRPNPDFEATSDCVSFKSLLFSFRYVARIVFNCFILYPIRYKCTKNESNYTRSGINSRDLISESTSLILLPVVSTISTPSFVKCDHSFQSFLLHSILMALSFK